MPYQTVLATTASTGGPVNPPAVLSWRSGLPTSISVQCTSLSSGTFSIQATLDDLQLVGGSSNAMWFGLSSGVSTTFPSTAIAATVFNASNVYPDSVFYTLLGPVAAVRLTVTGTSVVGAPWTMKVMQGEL
jgi:hypothetical protein